MWLNPRKNLLLTALGFAISYVAIIGLRSLSMLSCAEGCRDCNFVIGDGELNHDPDNAGDTFSIRLPRLGDVGAWDVGDELKLSGDKPPQSQHSNQAATAANAKPQAAESTQAASGAATMKAPAPVTFEGKQAIQSAAGAAATKSEAIVINTDMDPEKFWNNYFTSLPEVDEKNAAEVAAKRDAAIRAVATELMDQAKFDQVEGLIHRALRNGYARPWMYEALALALQADGKPKAEIERALMSAVDFANTPSDVMQVALYMARIGLDARAAQAA